MLTEECKQYIARYLGEKVGDKYCFTDSTAKKVKYWTVTDEEQLGSTVDAVTTIAIFGGYSYEDPVNKIGKITADTLKQKNGGNALTNDDIVWIANHSDGADKYCYSPTAPPPTGDIGYLTVIVTNVEKADVYVDGKYIGQSDITKYPLSVGTHTVRITKSGYEDYVTTVTIDKGKTTTITTALKPITTPTPTTGTAKICFKTVDETTGEEVNAWIYIDGKATYKQTPECFELQAKDYTVKFVADGYEDFETKITVVAGQDRTYTYRLKRKPEKEVKPIEIEVVERYVSEDMIDFLFEYSSIPTKIMRGVPTTFRLYFANRGGYGVKLNAWLEFQYQANPSEKYMVSLSDRSKDTVIPAQDGASLYFNVQIPSTASLGWYDVYLYYEIAEVVKE